MILAERLDEQIRRAGLSQNQLALRVGVAAQTIWKLVNGQSHSSVHLHRIARELQTSVEYLTGETDDPDPSGPLPALLDEDLAEVAEIDLAYGMGGTFLDQIGEYVPVTAERRKFDKAFLRNFTRSSPEQIFFARGAGDSMQPTILDSDIVLIDTAQSSLRLTDQLWACAFAGVEMIKRLRPRPDGSVAILSDNPAVPEDQAVDGELHLIGRVVAVVRKT